MEKVYDNCCGIDVHKKLIVACLICGRMQEIREFGATTRELLDLADWLTQNGYQMIAMESTASYWKPLYNILESCDRISTPLWMIIPLFLHFVNNLFIHAFEVGLLVALSTSSIIRIIGFWDDAHIICKRLKSCSNSKLLALSVTAFESSFIAISPCGEIASAFNSISSKKHEVNANENLFFILKRCTSQCLKIQANNQIIIR